MGEVEIGEEMEREIQIKAEASRYLIAVDPDCGGVGLEKAEAVKECIAVGMRALVTPLLAEIERLKGQAEGLGESLMKFNARIDELERERDELRARLP